MGYLQPVEVSLDGSHEEPLASVPLSPLGPNI